LISLSTISVKNVSKNFGSVKALQDVSFNVEPGDFYGILGPNGAGKTTLIRIITGQIKPDSGESITLGIDSEDSLKIRAKVGIVPEAESPPTFLTVQETLELVCQIRGVQDFLKKVDWWTEFFELGESRNTLCRDLSKGQRQKVMLASALIHEPKLLLLDEPFINLDPIYQRKIREYLLEYVSNGGTTLLCTHILEIAEKVCKNIALINKGRIVAQGPLNELRKPEETLEDTFMRLVTRM